MKKKIWLLVLTLAFTGALTGCGNSSAETVEPSQTISETGELKTVRIGYAGTGEVMQGVGGVAQTETIEKELNEVGYTAEFISLASGVVANEAYLGGQLDLIFYGETPFVTAVSNGTDLKAFTLLATSTPLGIIVSKESGIESVADLKGKKVSVVTGTILENYLISRLSDVGLTENDIEKVNDISAFYSGATDAAVITLQTVYALSASGIGTVIETSGEHASATTLSFAVGGSSYLDENPDVPKAIIRAVYSAKELIDKDHDVLYNNDVIANANQYPYEIIKKTYEDTDPDFEEFDQTFNEEIFARLNNTINILKTSGTISADLKAEEIIDTSYQDEVVAER